MMQSILEGAWYVSGLGLIVCGLALTTTMLPGKFGVYFASTAIIEWLEDTGMPLFCAGFLIISLALGLAG